MNRLALILAATTGAAHMLPATAAQLQLTTGIDYSSGDYGEATATHAVVVPFSLRLAIGNLSLRASVPYLGMRGPANVAPVVDDDSGDRSSNSGSGSSGSGSDDDDDDDDFDDFDDIDDDDIDDDDLDEDDFADDRDVHGLGDATLGATWTFQDIGGSRLYADLTGRVRLPTGDESTGLGRGATDYTALTELGWDGQGGGVFVIAGRRFLESVGTIERVDGWQAGTGFWRNLGSTAQFGMQGNWRQSASATGADPRSLDTFIAWRASRTLRVEISGTAGFSKASPDFAAGIKFSWRKGTR
jgi:hypothetical protein